MGKPARAPGEFKFVIPLDGTYVVRSEVGATGAERRWLVLRGWASDAGVDKWDGQMAPECVVGMVRAVNERSNTATPVFENERKANSATIRGPVGVDIDHSNIWNHQIGYVTRAAVLNESDIPKELHGKVTPPVMEVELEVDLGYSSGRDIQHAIDTGRKLGLSVYGEIKQGKRVLRSNPDGTTKSIQYFQNVDLHKIAVTTQPINNATWVEVVRRSMSGDYLDDMETEEIIEEEAAEEVAAPPEETPVADEIAAPVEGNLPEAVASDEPPLFLSEDNHEAVSAPLDVETPEPAPEVVLEPETVPDTAVPEPVEVTLPEPVEPAEVVARAESEPETPAEEQPAEGQWLMRAEYDSNMNELREILRPMPDFVARAEEVFGLVNTLNSLTQSQATLIESQASTINELSSRIEVLENRRSGSRTLTVNGAVGELVMRSEAEIEAIRVAELERKAAMIDAVARGDYREVENNVFGRFMNLPSPASNPYPNAVSSSLETASPVKATDASAETAAEPAATPTE